MGILNHHFSHFVTKEPKPGVVNESRPGLNMVFLGSVHQTMLLSFLRHEKSMYQVLSYSSVCVCACVCVCV